MAFMTVRFETFMVFLRQIYMYRMCRLNNSNRFILHMHKEYFKVDFRIWQSKRWIRVQRQQWDHSNHCESGSIWILSGSIWIFSRALDSRVERIYFWRQFFEVFAIENKKSLSKFLTVIKIFKFFCEFLSRRKRKVL